MIDLPPPQIQIIGQQGTVKEGASVCLDRDRSACWTTGREVPVLVFARDGSKAVISIRGTMSVTDIPMVIVHLPGCDLSLSSYLAKSFCPR